MANLKRNMIELVVNPQEVAEGGEPEIKKYWTPVFIPFTKVREAMDLAIEMEKGGDEQSDMLTMFDKLIDFIADLYGKQFTREELYNGIHAPDAINSLQEQLYFIIQGDQTESTKKFLAKKG